MGVSQEELRAGFVDDDDDDEENDLIYAVSNDDNEGSDDGDEGSDDGDAKPGVAKLASSGSKEGLGAALKDASALSLPSLVKSQTSQDKMKMMSLSLDTSLAQSYSRSATDVAGKSEYGPNSQHTIKLQTSSRSGSRHGSPGSSVVGSPIAERLSSRDLHSGRQAVPSLLLSGSSGSRPSSTAGSFAALEPARTTSESLASQGDRARTDGILHALAVHSARRDDASSSAQTAPRSERKTSARDAPDRCDSHRSQQSQGSQSHGHSQSHSQGMNSSGSHSGSDASLTTPRGSLPPLRGVPSPATAAPAPNSARRRSTGDALTGRNDEVLEPSGRVSPRARQDGRAAAAGEETVPILRKTVSALPAGLGSDAPAAPAVAQPVAAHPPSSARRPSNRCVSRVARD